MRSDFEDGFAQNNFSKKVIYARKGHSFSVLNFFDWIKDKLRIIRNGIRKKVPLLQGYFI